MDARQVQLMNAQNAAPLLKNAETDGVDLKVKKRRAAFGDITNNDVVEFGNKKKCAKKDDHRQAIKNVLKPAKMVEINKQIQSTSKVVLQPLKNVQPSNNTQRVSQRTTKAIRVPVISRAPPSRKSKAGTVTAPLPVPDDDEPVIASQFQRDDGSIPSQSQSSPGGDTITDDEEIDDLCERFEWIDVDVENKDSPFYLTDYVNDIFDYYKEREASFIVSDYMSTQHELSIGMRAILVDWLVEVQQNFELNHETLYMAVKMVDLYLVKQAAIPKDRLQLIGATALSIACKFEERSPPVLDDYLYICDDAYVRDDILDMETSILTTLGFDIGLPLSYTFLRRYAQCGRVSIPTLTLARFILESSLMDYTCVTCSESRLAAAALVLAMKMTDEGRWDATMVHYTGYILTDLAQLVRQLNRMIAVPPHRSLTTINTKYSHRIFHEVAKISTLEESELNALLGPH